MMRFIIVLCSFVPLAVEASQESVKSPNLPIVSMLGSLLLVLACIFICAYLMKKTNLLKNGRGKNIIKVVATQALTSKGRVQMIEIDGQQYLLGVTEQNITLLDKLEKPLASAQELENAEEKTPFSILLSKISNKNNE